MKKNCRIKNFPISFYSVVMGITGFVISLQKGVEIFSLSERIPNIFLFISVFVFLLISIFYLIKLAFFNKNVKEEFNHPVKINFFPTFSISLLLLSISFLDINILVSKYLWIFGTFFHLVFTFFIISVWIYHNKFKITHMNPSWFIPAVGNGLVPVSGVSHFSPEISWFFFSVGLFFWLILLIIFFNRIFFHEPLQEKLLPTLFILIAPPAVGFISYFKLTGQLNDFSRILYYFALFITALIFFQIKRFKNIKYYLSWWAYSFPIAAISIASALMFHITGVYVYKYIYLYLLIVLILLIFFLSIRTIKAIKAGTICVEED